jgi:hypothetical protein
LLEEHAIKAGATQQEWTNFVAYAGGFFGNMSNYHSFGDIKFVPDLPSFEIFSRILYSHPDIAKEGN